MGEMAAGKVGNIVDAVSGMSMPESCGWMMSASVYNDFQVQDMDWGMLVSVMGGELRSQTQIEAIAKWGTLNPLSQTKLDFLGTLDKPYEINKTNRASSIFLSDLIGETSPELLRRLMVETFEDVAPGRWRIVYTQDLSTSFGFGSLLRDVREVDVDLENNGEITCEKSWEHHCH